jgi:hypothetical protein
MPRRGASWQHELQVQRIVVGRAGWHWRLLADSDALGQQ